MVRKLLLLIPVLLLFLSVKAQNQPAEMADTMRSEGKIYVVVALILIVLTGLIAYLFIIDRNVKKLEKLISEKQK
jgi:hypothetical protein